MVINVKEVTKTLPIMQFCVFSQSTKIIVVINLLLLLHYAYIIRVLIIHNFFPIKELQHTVFIPTSTYKEAISEDYAQIASLKKEQVLHVCIMFINVII